MNGPNFKAMRIHGHGIGCKRVTWENWLVPSYRPDGVTEGDYPCTCGLDKLLNEWEERTKRAERPTC